MVRYVALCLVIATSTASADGFYFTEGFGGADVKDDMAAYMDNAFMFRVGLGIRRRNLAVEGWIAAAVNTTVSSESDYGRPNDDKPTYEGGYDYYDGLANLTMYGLDVKLLQPVSRHVEVYLRGSMSGAKADGELYGYGGRGLGIGAGAQLKGKVRALGFLWWPLFFTGFGPKITGALWIDTRYDFYRLHGSGRSIDAQLSSLTFGFAAGSDF